LEAEFEAVRRFSAEVAVKRCRNQMALTFLLAVAFNYPWELAQAPLYVGMDSLRTTLPHCFVASIGDGFLVLLIVLAGRLVLGDWHWFEHPGAGGYVLMATVGLLIGVSVEWAAVHVAGRWSYTASMPRLPGLDVGVLPVAQMLVLPPVIFWTARFISEGRSLSSR